jgi:hypothetical protein
MNNSSAWDSFTEVEIYTAITSGTVGTSGTAAHW